MSRSPDPIDLHVGARLRLLRMSRGVSQESLAGRLGLTFQQIQKYEKGQNRIGASRLYHLARALEAPVGYFFEGLDGAVDGEPDKATAALAFLATPEGLQLSLAFARIGDSATRRRIVDLVEALSPEGGAG